jgi:hypothetical protein
MSLPRENDDVPFLPLQIPTWAKEHFERTGTWPKGKSGADVGAIGESWSALDACLKQGLRGLPGGSSLAQVVRTLSDAQA